MRIGGMFPLEKVGKAINPEWPHLLYCMSGRCALYVCLLDIGERDGKVAYVPAYTCETVLASYLKAGWNLRYYDVDPQLLRPRFQEKDLEGVTVLALCGYYGFPTYDPAFVEKAKRRGIVILEDTTHTPFSVDPLADYAAGSLRKWMGIACGGVAYKRDGDFHVSLKKADEEHLRGRYQAMEYRRMALQSGDDVWNEKASQEFWDTEMRLRRMFDAYGSDEESVDIIRHYDFAFMREKRRRNYQVLLDALKPSPAYRPVFPTLRPFDVPSHFSCYAEDREKMVDHLACHGVKSTVYWPLPPMLEHPERYPGAQWIREHILSIQMDQRYGDNDMLALAEILNGYGN